MDHLCVERVRRLGDLCAAVPRYRNKSACLELRRRAGALVAEWARAAVSNRRAAAHGRDVQSQRRLVRCGRTATVVAGPPRGYGRTAELRCGARRRTHPGVNACRAV